MSTTPGESGPSVAELATGEWTLDPERSSVEFHVPNFWGLMTVKGRFRSYTGTLNLSREPAIELRIEAQSLDTRNRQRDKHLRSADFFDAERYPEVTFVSDSASLDGDKLTVRGQLHARGSSVPLELDGQLEERDGELWIEAATHAPHRELGMVWNPIRGIGPRSKLIVRGALVREAASGAENGDTQ